MAVPREIQLIKQKETADNNIVEYAEYPVVPSIIKPIEPPKEHIWQRDNYSSTQSRQCTVCGLIEESDPYKRSSVYKYTGAFGNAMKSFIPLSCPAHEVSGAELMERHRPVKQRVDNVEEAVETIHGRLVRLEAENAALKEQVNSDRADVVAFVQWLGKMAKEHNKQGLPSVIVRVQDQSYQLPPPVADLIRNVGVIDAEILEEIPIKNK